MAVALVVGAVVVLAGLLLATTAARRDRTTALKGLSREARRRDKSAAVAGEGAPVARSSRAIERAAVLERRGGTTTLVPAPAAPPAVKAPADPETYGVTRRQFLNRSIGGMFALGLSGFGAASIAFLWPQLSGGFGSKIRAGSLTEVLAQVSSTREPVYVAEGRFYLVPYPKEALDAAREVYAGGVLEGMEAGVTALYQKCVHLGCRVPWCKTAQWFECPCHGSQYNRVGEKRAGPAPRGLDRFAVSVDGGTVVVDTGALSVGPAVGANTTGQEAEGPHCT